MNDQPNRRIIIIDFWDDESKERGLAGLAGMLRGVSRPRLHELFEREGNIQIRELPVLTAERLGQRLETMGMLLQMVEEPYNPPPDTSYPPSQNPIPPEAVAPLPPEPENGGHDDSTPHGRNEDPAATKPDEEQIANQVSAEASEGRSSEEDAPPSPGCTMAHMGLVDIIYHGVKLYLGNFKQFYGTAFAMTLLGYAVLYGVIIAAIGSLAMGGPHDGIGDVLRTAAVAITAVLMAVVLYWLVFLYLIGCLVTGADMRIRGQPWDFAQARFMMKGRLLPFATTVLQVIVIVGFLLVAGIAAAFVLSSLLSDSMGPMGGPFKFLIYIIVLLYPAVIALRYLLVPHLVVLEGIKGFAALRQSSALMRTRADEGFFGWNINRGAIIMLAAFMANLIVTLTVLALHLTGRGIAAIGGDPLSFFSALPIYVDIPIQIAGVALQAVVTPFWVICLTFLYCDTRVRKEGLRPPLS